MKQLLGPLLRQTLGQYLEVAEHELDLSGQLSLSAVQLRKHLAGPLQVSGQVGLISARWCWSELLRQPVVVNLHDAELQLQLAEASEAENPVQTPQEPEPGFLGRLKRRLVDQLDLTVTNCHLSLAGLEVVAGGAFKRFSVAAVHAGEQVVELEGLELHLGPRQTGDVGASIAGASSAYLPPPPPPPPLPVFLWASPRGRARRFAGRRFVDLRGLDLEIDLEAVQIAWTRVHAECMLTLLRNLQDLRDGRDFRDCDSDPEFLDCEERPRPSWSAWLRSWGVLGPDEGEMPELPAELGASMEESPVGKAEFSLALANPTLIIVLDSSLEVELSCQMSFHLGEHDAWNLDVRLTRFAISELLEGNANVPIGGMTGSDDLVINADSRDKTLSLRSAQLEVQITPALLRCGLWAWQALESALFLKPSSEFVSWHVAWDVPLTVEIGKPWHSRTLLLKARFVCDSGADCSVLTCLQLDEHQLIEELALSLHRANKLVAMAELMRCQCDIRDLVTFIRVAKTLYNFRDILDVPGESPLELDVRIDTIEMILFDRDLELDCELLCNSLKLSLMQPSAAGIVADDVKVHVRTAGKEGGSLHIVSPVINVTLLKGLEAQLECELYCRDPDFEDAAIGCPSLRCIYVENERGCKLRAITLDCSLNFISLSTTETFLQRCRLACEYVYDHILAALFIEPVLLEERPFGLSIEAAEVVATPQISAGWLAGSTVCGMEPPVTNLLEELQSRPVPLTLLFQKPLQSCCFTVCMHPVVLNAVDFSVQRGIKARLEKSDITFKKFQQSIEGSWTVLVQKVAKHYLAQAAAALPKLFCNMSVGGLRLFDGTVSSAGTSLAFLRFGGTAIPQGALAGTLAKAVASATSSSLEKGRELRGGDRYRFGDLTRGLVSLSWERGVRGTASSAAAHAYDTGAVSTTAGASVGGVLLAPLGPVGVTGGMMGGAAVGRRVSESVGHRATAVRESISQTLAEGREARGEGQEDPTVTDSPAGSGYRFGDFTRGLLRAGRESRGGEGYKIGDLTRGAWSKMKR
ncbi:unnamed protein product [Symbiodinium natans]|uniref:Uncharacterized protein n=1 Tax=Symbiodinium natans TaxID=878477 RepID=A0A812K5V6_9DINO|nr:unnamed protein product [Symbiodinium natans]